MIGNEELKRYRSIVIQKIGNFLFSEKNRKFLIFLFFLMVSTIFWLIQTLNDDYETEVTMPLRLKNVPDNVVLTQEPPKEIRLDVQDKGTVLMNYLFGQTFYPLTIDFKEHAKSGHVQIPLSSLQKSINAQLATSTRVISEKPDTIDIIYTQGEAKKVPVRLTGKFTAGKQYYIAKVRVQPDSVMVYAPHDLLDTLRSMPTAYAEMSDLCDTTCVEIPLRRIKGVKTIPGSVKARFYPDIYTEKSVEVPIVGVEFPKDKTLKTFPSKVKVSFQVGLHLFKSITAEQFRIEIPYEELSKCTSDKYTLHLKTMPKELKRIRLSPESIDYLIEQNPTNGD